MGGISRRSKDCIMSVRVRKSAYIMRGSTYTAFTRHRYTPPRMHTILVYTHTHTHTHTHTRSSVSPYTLALLPILSHIPHTQQHYSPSTSSTVAVPRAPPHETAHTSPILRLNEAALQDSVTRQCYIQGSVTRQCCRVHGYDTASSNDFFECYT